MSHSKEKHAALGEYGRKKETARKKEKMLRGRVMFREIGRGGWRYSRGGVTGGEIGRDT